MRSVVPSLAAPGVSSPYDAESGAPVWLIRMIGFTVTPFSLSAAASLIWSRGYDFTSRS